MNPFDLPRLSAGIAVVLLAALAGRVGAEWTGSGELGLVLARGNTDTETLNTELKLDYADEKWSNATRISYLRSESDGDLEANRFVFRNNTDYALSEFSYLTGVGRYDWDEFSSFEFQTSLAAGYGRKLFDNERQALSIEAGPGVRHSEVRDTGETETELIGRLGSDYRWTISETAELTNVALVETGSSNTFLENETSLTVAINDSLALETGLSVRHNTEVEPGRDNTDFLTTINLVYSFL